MKIQDRNKAFKQLSEIKERVENGTQTQQDSLLMIDIFIKLVRSVKID